jgi:hypothetical protein
MFGEDYDSLVMDSCDLLSHADCRFIVSGFGQVEWPVSGIGADFTDVPWYLGALFPGLFKIGLSGYEAVDIGY